MSHIQRCFYGPCGVLTLQHNVIVHAQHHGLAVAQERRNILDRHARDLVAHRRTVVVPEDVRCESGYGLFRDFVHGLDDSVPFTTIRGFRYQFAAAHGKELGSPHTETNVGLERREELRRDRNLPVSVMGFGALDTRSAGIVKLHGFVDVDGFLCKINIKPGEGESSDISFEKNKENCKRKEEK